MDSIDSTACTSCRCRRGRDRFCLSSREDENAYCQIIASSAADAARRFRIHSLTGSRLFCAPRLHTPNSAERITPDISETENLANILCSIGVYEDQSDIAVFGRRLTCTFRTHSPLETGASQLTRLRSMRRTLVVYARIRAPLLRRARDVRG